MAGGLVLRLTRTRPAPRAAVYRVLSDAGELAKWWGPRGELLLTQTGFVTEQRRALHEAGWTDSLARLEQFLRDASDPSQASLERGARGLPRATDRK